MDDNGVGLHSSGMSWLSILLLLMFMVGLELVIKEKEAGR